jgi:phosphate ABC transporter permease protein PstC
VRRVGTFLIELLAAIPSVVYGFWGRFFLAPIVQHGFDAVGPTYLVVVNAVRPLLGLDPLPPDPPNTGGTGILSAGLVLAVMILPYITAISFDVIQAVPRTSREGALALGASRWQTIWQVVLPTARPGIVAAAFLALGRALGETMAVTMLIGNQPVISLSPFAYGNTIASKIALSVGEANDPSNRAALIALAVLLFLVTAVFNLLARWVLAYLSRPARPRTPPAGDEADTTRDPADLPTPPPGFSPPKSRAALWNRVMTVVLTLSFLTTVVPLFLILGMIAYKGAKAVEPTLFLEREKSTLSDEEYERYKGVEAGGGGPTGGQVRRPDRAGRAGARHARQRHPGDRGDGAGGAGRAGGGGVAGRGAAVADGERGAVPHRTARRGAVHRHRPVHLRRASRPELPPPPRAGGRPAEHHRLGGDGRARPHHGAGGGAVGPRSR